MMKTKPWSGGTDEEYETQLFGFGTQCLKIAFREMVEEKIRSTVKDVESSLQEALELNETDKVTWSRSCDKLIRKYCERAGPSMDVIDEEIDRIFKVPSYVVLPEDEVQINQITEAEHQKLKSEVADLMNRVDHGSQMLTLLKAEEEEIASMEKAFEITKKDMEVLDAVFKDCENNKSMIALNTERQILCESMASRPKMHTCYQLAGIYTIPVELAPLLKSKYT